MQEIIKNEFSSHIETSIETLKCTQELIETAANQCIKSIKSGSKILLFGNGGSAADAQHIAAELVGRFKNERKGLPAIALTTDSSIITSISNDYDYINVFKRQIEALAKNNDIVIGISTGGSSKNVIKGLESAKKLGCFTIGLSGKDGGKFNSLCDLNIKVPSYETPRIQEMHIIIGHIICQLIDNEFS